LNLNDGSEVHDLDQTVWRYWCQAAAVTFARVHGKSLQPFVIVRADGSQLKAAITWTAPDERTKRSHANTIDATECGAYAVASWALFAAAGWLLSVA
jgi:hypothetical protein